MALLLATAALVAWQSLQPQRQPICDWLIVGLVFTNLFWYGHAYNPAGSLALYPPTPVTDYLRDYLRQNQMLSRTVPLQHGSALLFGPNAIADYGVQQPGGYSSLVISAYHDLVSRGDLSIDLPESTAAATSCSSAGLLTACSTCST